MRRILDQVDPDRREYLLLQPARRLGKTFTSLLVRACQAADLNNRLEGDHGKLKRLIQPTLGFQSMKTAYATIKGFEVMRMFNPEDGACAPSARIRGAPSIRVHDGHEHTTRKPMK